MIIFINIDFSIREQNLNNQNLKKTKIELIFLIKFYKNEKRIMFKNKKRSIYSLY